MLASAAKLPGGLVPAFQALAVRPLRRLPLTWGWMSKRPVEHEVMDAWFLPVRKDREVRRDLRKYAVSIPSKATLREYAERLRDFDRPTLVAWAAEDKIMPPEHGRRLAEMMPQATLVEIPDSYTLVPQDAPDALAEQIRAFATAKPAAATAG
jgi:pimeloyl-ACP methyl ester carboxylesterase